MKPIAPAVVALFKSILPKRGGGAGVANVGVMALLCVATSLARGEGDKGIQRAIVESFPYNSNFRAENPETESPQPTQPSDVDSEVVTLPEVEVRTHTFDRQLAAALENSQPLAPRNHTVLGTGIREKDFGKVRGHVATVFYVPVRFGISW
ncbi:MAG TPA: hypothetical protein VGD81_04650 [Opitutaceae bacterium]